METNFTQQEILLNTAATQLAKDWCPKTDTGKPDQRTEKQKIEEACWNGLIREEMPEIFVAAEENKPLALWKVQEMSAVLELELSDYPAIIDKYYSINPYIVMTEMNEN